MADETKVTETTNAEVKETATGAEDTPKAKTEEEIRAELQKEYEKMADKRVTDAIKKKEKEWADKQAKEKMTEDERKRVEEQERLQAQAKRDLDLTIKGLKLDVVDAVAELGLDAGFRNLIAVEDLATIADEDDRKKKLTEPWLDSPAHIVVPRMRSMLPYLAVAQLRQAQKRSLRTPQLR